jgi:hypothetical protein
MSKSIRIFKSFEEQEKYNHELMINTTPEERFRKLYIMQQMTKKFHQITDKTRKIIIHHSLEGKENWHSLRNKEI